MILGIGIIKIGVGRKSNYENKKTKSNRKENWFY
jgi:hypothetical protein